MICVNMPVQDFSEKGAFFRVRLRSEQIRDKGVFFANLMHKGTFFMSCAIVWNYLGHFSRDCSPCDGHSKLSMLPFRDKGIILVLIQVTFHAKNWFQWFISEVRVRFLGKGSEKGVILNHEFQRYGCIPKPSEHAC